MFDPFRGRASTPAWGTTEYGSKFGSSRRPVNESARYAARASPVMMSQPRGPHSYSPAPQQAGRTRPATEKDVSMICRGVRAGTVLRKQTILKADHFPSGQNPDLSERINGAPNFRQVNTLPIFGVGQPTVDAMLDVVARVNTPKMIWCNLREEPVVYINCKPFCLKDRSMPFNNIENTGIEAADVERMEETLRREIIREASCNGGEILLHDETVPEEAGVAAWGEVVAYWETITADSVMTPAQAYGRLKQQGFNVDYHRVPITDECSPEEKVCEQLIQIMRSVRRCDGVVFNCQLGRGRTTTGMVIACILWRCITGMPQDWSTTSTQLWKPGSCSHEWGEYTIVNELMAKEALTGAPHRKHFVDCAINQCNHMQNLRAAILDKKQRGATKPRELSKAVRYLERYVWLILFNIYVCVALDTTSSEFRDIKMSFSAWARHMSQHVDLYPMLDRITLD